jgi:hypothetical protein
VATCVPTFVQVVEDHGGHKSQSRSITGDGDDHEQQDDFSARLM